MACPRVILACDEKGLSPGAIAGILTGAPQGVRMPFVPSNGSSDPASRLYQGEAGRRYHEGKRGLPPSVEPWLVRLRAERFQPWVAASDTVVELGVGAGWNLAGLHCARRIGVDPADHLAPGLAAHGIEWIPHLKSLINGMADLALCHHTLEHLLHPADALAELARVLKPQGRLVLGVPWETERRYRHYRSDDRNQHLYHWNVQNLGNLAAVLGWRMERLGVRAYGWDRFTATLAWRWHLGERGFRLLRRTCMLLRPLREVELIARRPVDPP
jgi:SAM-dependent methyltransferase